MMEKLRVELVERLSSFLKIISLRLLGSIKDYT